MSVSTASSVPTTSTTAPPAPTGKKTLSQDDFMKLFITQLQYQDPLQPMDSYQMASQMAMMNNVEAIYNMNSTMEKLLDYQTSQNNLQLLTLLDRNVQATGNLVAVNKGVAEKMEFVMESPPDTCTVEIYDERGQLVRTIDVDTQGAGTYELRWDGKDAAGNKVTDGSYQYVVKAKDAEGAEVAVQSNITGQVTDVAFNAGKALVTLDNQIQIDVGSVTRVY